MKDLMVTHFAEQILILVSYDDNVGYYYMYDM